LSRYVYKEYIKNID